MEPQFQQLRAGEEGRLLPLMQQLYAHEAIAWSRDTAERALAGLLVNHEQGGAWLIFAEGEVAGYFVMTLAYSLEFAGVFALLDEFYVSERWRGRGIGTKAITFIVAEAKRRGAQAVRLEVGHANERAFKLYAGQGFKAEERHLLTRRLG